VQGVSGCTIVADSSTGADALATALFVLGAEKGLEVIEHENGIGLMITSAGKIILSKEMMKKICHNHFQDYLEVVF
jgi:thiamine biosynthesis lipoprotein